MERMIPIGGNSFFTSCWIRISSAQRLPAPRAVPRRQGDQLAEMDKIGLVVVQGAEDVVGLAKAGSGCSWPPTAGPAGRRPGRPGPSTPPGRGSRCRCGPPPARSAAPPRGAPGFHRSDDDAFRFIRTWSSSCTIYVFRAATYALPGGIRTGPGGTPRKRRPPKGRPPCRRAAPLPPTVVAR